MKRKLIFALLLCLLCTVARASPSLSETAVETFDGSPALLVHAGRYTFLAGGDDAALELPESIDAIVRLCDHPEHSGAVDALAERYGVPVIERDGPLSLNNAAWDPRGLLVEIDGQKILFGADAAQADADVYRCDGTFLQRDESAAPAAEPAYIGNRRSHVLHVPSCRTLPAEKNRVLFNSYDEAISQGYRPCQNCDPGSTAKQKEKAP